jgi:voltage-gated sodium channel
VKKVTFKERMVHVREAKWFSNLTTAIIIFYASVLGFKTIGEVESEYGFLLTFLDYAVTVYFLVEILIKLYAEERTLDFFKSGWNVFDFIIVVITVVPMDNTAIAPVARMLRIFRVLRLLTARPELKNIIDMLIKAIPSIIDIVILMFIVFYVYAIVGNFLFEDAESGLWKDFLISMLTLFRILTFEDWTDVMYEGMEIYPWSWIYFVSFVIIAAFVFFNLFVAVIIGEMEKINNKDIHDEMHEDHGKIDLILAEVKALRSEMEELKKKPSS